MQCTSNSQSVCSMQILSTNDYRCANTLFYTYYELDVFYSFRAVAVVEIAVRCCHNEQQILNHTDLSRAFHQTNAVFCKFYYGLNYVYNLFSSLFIHLLFLSLFIVLFFLKRLAFPIFYIFFNYRKVFYLCCAPKAIVYKG